MRRLMTLFLVAGLIVGLVTASHLSLQAQSEIKPVDPPTKSLTVAATELARQGASGSIQDALLKPYAFRFARPTPLAEVAQRLGHDLGIPVVLDLAALERLDVTADDTVKLELQGVRLKTGLKLLLDQAGLTYKIVAEDNLLVLTDKQGSEDPIEQVMAEIHEIHRDIHDIQDALDEVRELTGLTGEERSASVRKPTIIEEVPDNPDAKPQEGAKPKPSKRPDAGTKPGLSSGRPRTSL